MGRVPVDGLRKEESQAVLPHRRSLPVPGVPGRGTGARLKCGSAGAGTRGSADEWPARHPERAGGDGRDRRLIAAGPVAGDSWARGRSLIGTPEIARLFEITNEDRVRGRCGRLIRMTALKENRRQDDWALPEFLRGKSPASPAKGRRLSAFKHAGDFEHSKIGSTAIARKAQSPATNKLPRNPLRMTIGKGTFTRASEPCAADAVRHPGEPPGE